VHAEVFGPEPPTAYGDWKQTSKEVNNSGKTHVGLHLLRGRYPYDIERKEPFAIADSKTRGSGK
jgi:hypothetical protein